MASSSQIWLVDDDKEHLRLLGAYLTDQGYEVRGISGGKQLMARLESQRPDLVVLDVMLQGDDGLTLLRRLRSDGDSLPVVILTAKGDPMDRIIGLEQGADDYIGKPFLPRELTARIDAVLRRRVTLPEGAPVAGGGRVEFGGILLDLASRTMLCGGTQVPITSGEFRWLATFVSFPYRPLTRERLLEITRGPGSSTDSRSMDVQVSRIRKLVESDPSRPRYIQTVWGYGYVFIPDGKTFSR